MTQPETSVLDANDRSDPASCGCIFWTGLPAPWCRGSSDAEVRVYTSTCCIMYSTFRAKSWHIESLDFASGNLGNWAYEQTCLMYSVFWLLCSCIFSSLLRIITLTGPCNSGYSYESGRSDRNRNQQPHWPHWSMQERLHLRRMQVQQHYRPRCCRSSHP